MWVRRVTNLNADLSATALSAFKAGDETRVRIGNDEVGAELRNGLVEINVSGVAAHRFRTMLLAVGYDAIAVFSEVAEGPVDGGHNRLKGP